MNSRSILFLSVVFLQISVCMCNPLGKKDVRRELYNSDAEDFAQEGQSSIGVSERQIAHCPECVCVSLSRNTSYCGNRSVDACEETFNHAAYFVRCPGKRHCLCGPIESYTFHCCNIDAVPECPPYPPLPTTTPPPTTTTAEEHEDCETSCFPSSAKVFLENGKSVTMSELKVGDRVQTVSSGGMMTFDTVRTFLKKDHTVTTTYKSISTSVNTTISLTGNHLIYSRKTSAGSFIPEYADQVSIGDEVLVYRNHELSPVKVVNVSNILMKGAYVPITMNGNILVEEVLASCYDFANYDVSQTLLTPLQWFPGMVDWIFGNSHGHEAYIRILDFVSRF